MNTATGHLTLKDIAELAQVSRPAVSNWRSRYSDFPEPVEESTPRKPLFDADGVIAWLKHKAFFPEGAEEDLQLASLWATANLLRNHLPVDEIPLVVLSMLALDQDPTFEVPAEYDQFTGHLSEDTLEEVKRGIASLRIDDYAEAANQVVDRFLGVGSRGDRSQYGTSTSLSSAALIAAASTTAEHARTVVDPACGIAGTLLGVGAATPEAELLGAELHPPTAALARLLVHLAGSTATIHTADSLFNDPFAGIHADVVVCEPPLAVRWPREHLSEMERTLGPLRGLLSDDVFLLYAAQHVSAEGRAYVLTSTGTTYRPHFREHRQRLAAQGQIEAVVDLPAGVFSATRIPAVMWVLRSGGAEEPLLIDASGHTPETIPTRIAEWLTAARNRKATDVPYKAITLADVVTNDGSLSPSTYLAEPISPDVARTEFDSALQSLETTAKDLMRIRTPRVTADAIPSSASSTTLGDLIQDGHFRRMRGIYRPDKELENGKARLARPNRNIEPAFVEDFNDDHVLRPGDILMPRIGELPAWVHQDDGRAWVPSDSLIVFRPTSDEYDPYFIAACLNAPANIDTRSTLSKRHPLDRITIPELGRDQRATVADAHRSLADARSAARQLEREAEHASDALLNLVFSEK